MHWAFNVATIVTCAQDIFRHRYIVYIILLARNTWSSLVTIGAAIKMSKEPSQIFINYRTKPVLLSQYHKFVMNANCCCFFNSFLLAKPDVQNTGSDTECNDQQR